MIPYNTYPGDRTINQDHNKRGPGQRNQITNPGPGPGTICKGPGQRNQEQDQEQDRERGKKTGFCPAGDLWGANPNQFTPVSADNMTNPTPTQDCKLLTHCKPDGSGKGICPITIIMLNRIGGVPPFGRKGARQRLANPPTHLQISPTFSNSLVPPNPTRQIPRESRPQKYRKCGESFISC